MITNARFISPINHRSTTFFREAVPTVKVLWFPRTWNPFAQPIRSRIVSGANKLCTTFFFRSFIYSIYNCIVTSVQLIGMSPREYWFARDHLRHLSVRHYGNDTCIGRPLWHAVESCQIGRQTIYYGLHPPRLPAGWDWAIWIIMAVVIFWQVTFFSASLPNKRMYVYLKPPRRRLAVGLVLINVSTSNVDSRRQGWGTISNRTRTADSTLGRSSGHPVEPAREKNILEFGEKINLN